MNRNVNASTAKKGLTLLTTFFMCSFIFAHNPKETKGYTSDMNQLIDSLNNHNQLIKSYQDTLTFISSELKLTQEKLDNNEQLVSNWGLYSATLASILIVLTIGSSVIVARRAKDVAFEELRESKDEIKKDLEQIKDMKLKANVAFGEFGTALGLLKEEAAKRATGDE